VYTLQLACQPYNFISDIAIKQEVLAETLVGANTVLLQLLFQGWQQS